jgi:hypothetical protein
MYDTENGSFKFNADAFNTIFSVGSNPLDGTVLVCRY